MYEITGTKQELLYHTAKLQALMNGACERCRFKKKCAKNQEKLPENLYCIMVYKQLVKEEGV